ncbi:MAG: hypothetical protein ACKOCN_10250 [Planctomycetaceae bacterium]
MGVPRAPSDAPSVARRSGESLIRWIMGAVLAWGCVQAAGAWTLNHDWRRPLMVMGCVVAFLGFWSLLLRSRNRAIRPEVAEPARDRE